MPINIFRHFYFKQFWFRNCYFSLTILVFLSISVFIFSTKFNKKLEISSQVSFLNFSYLIYNSFDFYPNGTKWVYFTGETVILAVGVENLSASRFKAQGSSLRGRMTLLFLCFLLAVFQCGFGKGQAQGFISTGDLCPALVFPNSYCLDIIYV